jgi:hypothetical protein
MPKKTMTKLMKSGQLDLSNLSNVSEIQVLWVERAGEGEGFCFYHAKGDAIQWFKAKRSLRFTATCIDGEYTLDFLLNFKSSGIMLHFGLIGERSMPMMCFEGREGVLLDYRTWREFISVLIKFK